jgi:hypothetical protein
VKPFDKTAIFVKAEAIEFTRFSKNNNLAVCKMSHVRRIVKEKISRFWHSGI